MDESSMEQNEIEQEARRLRERDSKIENALKIVRDLEEARKAIERLQEALRLIRDVANVSEGVEFYAMIADKALNDGEKDGKK